MKRLLNLLIVVFAIIAMTGCNSQVNIDEHALFLYSPQHGVDISLKSSSVFEGENSSPWRINLTTSISHTYDLDKWWEDSAFVRDKMKKTYDTIRKHSPNLCIENNYIYNCITEIHITANKPICGRVAGEELSELFEMHLNGIVFAYPYGDFVKFEDNPIVYEIDEWTKGRYITQKYFYIVPKESITAEGIDNNTIFTISCTFDNGVIRSNSVSFLSI